MTPSQLVEHVFAAGLTLSLVFWINMLVAWCFGFFDKEKDLK